MSDDTENKQRTIDQRRIILQKNHKARKFMPVILCLINCFLKYLETRLTLIMANSRFIDKRCSMQSILTIARTITDYN